MIITASLVVLIVVLRASSITGSFVDDVRELFGIDTGDEEPVVTDVTTILLRTQEQGILQTYSGEILVEERVERANASFLRNSVLEIRWVGLVQAGVDLTQMTEDDFEVNEADGSIVVHLPPASLTGCFLQQPQRLSGTTCGDLSPFQSCSDRLSDMEEVAYSNGIDYLFSTAMEANFVGEASQQAQDVLRGFFRELGYERVTFIVDPTPGAPHSSCVSS